MKKVILVIGSLLMLSFSSLVLADIKIGVLDVNRVLANLPQIKAAQADLKKRFDKRGQDLLSLQNSFRSDLDKYKEKNVDLKGDALKKEQRKIIDENKKLQETRISLQQDLAKAQNEALSPILQQIEKVVNKIAQDQKYDLIVARSSTVYNNQNLEITDQVIAAMTPPAFSTPAAKPVAMPAPMAAKTEVNTK